MGNAPALERAAKWGVGECGGSVLYRPVGRFATKILHGELPTLGKLALCCTRHQAQIAAWSRPDSSKGVCMSDVSSWPEGSLQPMGAAYQWHDALLALHVVGDGVIAAGCAGLALLLLHVRQGRADVPKSGLLALATCVLLLAVVHVLNIWNLWHVQHWLLGAAQLTTGIVAAPSRQCWGSGKHTSELKQ